MKKLLCFALTGILTMSMGVTCFAAQKNTTNGNPDEVTIERAADEIYPAVDTKSITDGYSRASWGEGVLHCTDPLFDTPSGYAETKTYSGSAYYMYAQLQLIDADSISYLSGKQEAYYTNSVVSATLKSKTEACSFHGSHGIQDTSTSSTQTAHTQEYFD